MFTILFDEVLHLFRAIVDAIRRERKAIGIEPMVVSAKHLNLEIITNLIYQVYLQERLSTYKIPDDTFLLHLFLMIENIVNSSLSYLPGHPLLRVFAYEVAILTSELAILRDNESDVLSHARLPPFIMLLNIFHTINSYLPFDKHLYKLLCKNHYN